MTTTMDNGMGMETAMNVGLRLGVRLGIIHKVGIMDMEVQVQVQVLDHEGAIDRIVLRLDPSINSLC